MTRVVLASVSPARLATLRAAGLEPAVVAPGVDERAVAATLDDPTPLELAGTLAAAKCAAVAGELPASSDQTLVIGCDSVLELDGEAYGKPASATEAVARWQRMRGSSGHLHTGHCVRLLGDGACHERRAVASTLVRFVDLGDDEVEAYVATGEPLGVAGAFTMEGLGGAYVRSIEGDPLNVVGLSLSLLRELVIDLGVSWHTLWQTRAMPD